MAFFKGEFADDVALLAMTREAAELSINTYDEICDLFALKITFEKTKFMVAGHDIQAKDRLPLPVRNARVEHVSNFPYLGSLVASDGRVDIEIDNTTANASKAFGPLQRGVFKDAHLSIETKRKVYQACVLSVLLYEGECWTLLKRHLEKVKSFHHRCLRTVLGITNQKQWKERI